MFRKVNNVVQYYSGGEEVLQKASIGIPWSIGAANPFGDLGRNSWNISEKAKGGRQLSGGLFSGDPGGGLAI